jgi:heat shock protein HtpX
MYRAIAANKRNTVLIIVLFLVFIGLLGWLASVIWHSWAILIIVMVVAIGYAIVQYFAASGEAVAASGAVEIAKADNPRLWNTVENITIATGMPMPRVYIVNDPAPNAFATGRDPQHAVVAATTGLLDIMDDRELQGVMAHELGHVRNYDIRLSMIVFGLTVAVGLVADLVLRFSIFGGLGGRGNRDGGGGTNNPVMLIVGLVALILAPILASLVQLAVSRQREYLADATSAMTTRDPDGLAGALAKLEKYGRPMRTQSSSMSHLWISNPLRPSAMAKLFSTHPPLQERIARLKKIGGGF